MHNPLRDHQHYAVDLLRRSLREGHRRPLLSMPTGSGKTLTAAQIIENSLRRGKRVLYTVPALVLIEQTVRAFWAEGIRDIGIIQGSNNYETDYSRPVQVASVETLRRRVIPPVDLAIVDEAHVLFEFYRQWFPFARYPIIGLSATPWTRGLGELYDDLITPIGIPELQRAGLLVREKPYGPDHPDLSKIETVAGDYHKGQLSALMRSSDLVGNAVAAWKKLGNGLPTFSFAVDRAHGKALQRQFQSGDVPTGYIDGETDRAERQRVLTQYRNREIINVVNVACLTLGVDEDVRCVSLCRSTKSEMLFVQIIGRGLRPGRGKDCLKVLDHSDTYLNLGYAADLYRDALDGRDAKAKAPREKERALPKQCPSCGYLKEAGVRECGDCGFAPERQCDVVVHDGDLAAMETRKVAERETRQRWFSGLIHVEQARGYRKGWAAATFKAKFSVWPDGLTAAAAEPDLEVLRFVKYRLIKHARRPSEVANVAV